MKTVRKGRRALSLIVIAALLFLNIPQAVIYGDEIETSSETDSSHVDEESTETVSNESLNEKTDEADEASKEEPSEELKENDSLELDSSEAKSEEDMPAPEEGEAEVEDEPEAPAEVEPEAEAEAPVEIEAEADVVDETEAKTEPVDNTEETVQEEAPETLEEPKDPEVLKETIIENSTLLKTISKNAKNNGTTGGTRETPVAKRIPNQGDVIYYTSLSSAIEDERDETIVIIADFTESNNIFAERNFTVDLAGHTVSMSDRMDFYVISGTFTLEDSSQDKNGALNFSYYNRVMVDGGNAGFVMNSGNLIGVNCVLGVNMGTATINDGTLDSTSNDDETIYVEGSGKVIINGGTIKNDDGVGVECIGTGLYESNGMVTLNDGTIEAEVGIHQSLGGRVIINGGTVNGSELGIKVLAATGDHGVDTLDINGGKISGGSAGISASTGIVTISPNSSGGEDPIISSGLDGKSLEHDSDNPDAFRINGGYFSDYEGNGDKFTRADGKMLIASKTKPGYFELGTAEAKIEETGAVYASLEEGVDAVTEGQTLTLLADVSYTGEYNYLQVDDRTFTLNLNNHTISSQRSGSAYGTIAIKSGTLTITDNSDESNGKIANTCSSGLAVGVKAGNGGNIILEKGTIDASGYAGVGIASEGKVLSINGGTIRGTANSIFFQAGSHDKYECNLNGGLFEQYTGNYSPSDTSEFGLFRNYRSSDHPVNINGGYYSHNTPNDEPENYIMPEDHKLMASATKEGFYELGMPVVKIGEVEYTSLTNAIDVAKDEDVIEVLRDYTETESRITVDKKVTIDLAGYTITKPGEIYTTTTVSIEDSSDEQTGKIAFAPRQGSNQSLYVSGILTVESGTIVSETAPIVKLYQNSSINVNRDATVICTADGTAIQGSDNGSRVYVEGKIQAKGNAVENGKNGMIVIYAGCSVISEEGTALTASGGDQTLRMFGGTVTGKTGIQVNNKAKAYIEGGEISGSEYGLYTDGGTVEVSAGKISGGNYGVYSAGGTTTISGKPIITSEGGKSVGVAEGKTFKINGGLYSDNEGNGDAFTRPTKKLLGKGADPENPDYYALGTFVVSNVEQDMLYAGLDEAAAAVSDGETLKLLDDISFDENTIFDTGAHAFTLDLDGYAITGQAAHTINVDYRASLTIVDSSDEGTGKIENIGSANNGSAVYVGGAGGSLGGGTLIVNGGTIAGSGASGGDNTVYGIDFRGKTITINDGTITGKTSGIFFDVDSGDSCTVNAGTVQGGGKSMTVRINDTDDENAKVHINGGKFSDEEGNDNDKFIRDGGRKLQDPDGDQWYELEPVVKDALLKAIQDATVAPDGVTTSEDGKELKPGTKYTTAAEKQALLDAIAAAQAVYDDPDVLQAEVNEATASMKAATQTYIAAIKTAATDKTALETAITDATTDKNGTAVSTDGKDQKPGTQYVDQDTQDALTDAIATAQAVMDKEDATQNEVDAAVTALNNAKKAFDDAKKTAATDKSALTNAINAATADKNDTPVSADGKDQKPGTQYVDQATQDAFTTAITAAQAVADKEDATQNEVDGAVTALNAAKKAFDDAKKTAATDKTALETAITNATTDKNNTPVSADGKDQKPGTQYVDQATQDALTAAIEAAQAVADKADATQNEVDAAVTALNAAKETFDKAKKTAAVDKIALTNAINAATADKNDTPISADGKDLPNGTVYVEQATQDALTTAIATAQAVVDDKDATQNEVDATVTALNAAKDAFDQAKKTAKHYDITFNPGSKGTGTYDKAVVNDGEEYTLPENPFTGQDYWNFDGWKVGSDATIRQPGYSFTPTTDTEVTAQWKATEWGVWIGGKKVTANNYTDVLRDKTDEKPASVTFDPATNTITFTNATIEMDSINNTRVEAGIRYHMNDHPDLQKMPLTIKLVGDNKIVNKVDENWAELHGIITFHGCATEMIFTGGGSLEITTTSDKLNSGNWGIYSRLNTVIDGASVTVHMPGEGSINGYEINNSDESNYTLTLKNNAELNISAGGNGSSGGLVSNGTGENVIVEEGSTLEVVSDDAAFKNANISDATAVQGALVGPDATDETARVWDGETDLNNNYKYILIPYSTDKSELEEAISQAEDAEDGIVVSADGKDLKPGTTYTTQAEKDALDEAIEAAQAVFDDPSAPQPEIDAATQAIKDATTTYNNAKKIAAVDKSDLEDAIDAATDDGEGMSISEDGKDLPEGTEYVTQETKDALDAAITAAQAVLGNEDATQNEIDAATTAMKAAKKAFDDAKKTAVVDRSELEDAIADASEDSDDTPVSTDGYEVPDGKGYVDQDAKDALDEAIAAAQEALGKEGTTQNEIDAATAAIKAAKEAFDEAKTKAVVDRSELENAIAESTEDGEDTPVSKDGKDQTEGTEYVNQAAKDALDKAIAEAQKVLDNPNASQKDVDEAVDAMNAAKQAFDAAKKKATVDKEALKKAVDEAINPVDISESEDGKEIEPEDKWATSADKAAYEKALSDAKNVLSDSNATQNQVDAALAALQEAAKQIKDGEKEDPTPTPEPTPTPTPEPTPEPTPTPDPEEDIIYSNTEGNGTVWTKGSKEDATFVFKRSENDSQTFGHFNGILVDGVSVDTSKYTASPGSVIINLKASYMETLSVGEHTITAIFTDGNNPTAKFTIVTESVTPDDSKGDNKDGKKDTKPADKNSDKKSDGKSSSKNPKTGDENNIALWILLFLGAASSMAIAGKRRDQVIDRE